MFWAGARLAALDGLNGRLALLETAGTATGGLLGGMIAALDGTYVLLIVSVVFLSLTSLAGAVIVFPRDVRWVGAGMREGLRDELVAIAAMAKRPGDVRLVLALATSAAMFVGLYTLMYLLLGARSVTEQTLLHNAVSSQERSGMASVQSVAIRGGGVLSSAVGSTLVPLVGLSGVWMALAVIAVAPIITTMLNLRYNSA